MKKEEDVDDVEKRRRMSTVQRDGLNKSKKMRRMSK